MTELSVRLKEWDQEEGERTMIRERAERKKEREREREGEKERRRERERETQRQEARGWSEERGQ